MSATYVRWNARRNAWHMVEGDGETLCGRRPAPPLDWSDTLPAGRSCENCLRIARRRADSTAVLARAGL